MKSENRALILSTAAAFVLGILGIAFAPLTNSNAILLDGLFNISYFATAILTLKVAQIIQRPDDEQFPFGYGYFEALINAFKGFLILGVSLIAFYDSIEAVFTGGREIATGHAIIYASIASLICVIVAVILHFSHRSNKSPLVKADSHNWTLNSIVSITVLLAFSITGLLDNTEWPLLNLYVDPVLVGIVVCISLGIPIRLTWNSLMALLNRAPSSKIRQPIVSAIHSAISDLTTTDVHVRMIQPGRTPYMLVHVLLSENGHQLTTKDLDSYRIRILEAVLEVHKPVVIDVVFTTNKKFAVPTTGFIEVEPHYLKDGND